MVNKSTSSTIWTLVDWAYHSPINKVPGFYLQLSITPQRGKNNTSEFSYQVYLNSSDPSTRLDNTQISSKHNSSSLTWPPSSLKLCMDLIQDRLASQSRLNSESALLILPIPKRPFGPVGGTLSQVRSGINKPEREYLGSALSYPDLCA